MANPRSVSGRRPGFRTCSKYENWEFAYALILGTGAAARPAKEIGLEPTRERSCGLARHARECLATISGVTVLDRGETRCAIATVHVAVQDPDELHARLSERGFNTTVSRRAYAARARLIASCECLGAPARGGASLRPSTAPRRGREAT